MAMKILILHPIQDILAGSTKALLNIVSQSKRYGVDIIVGVPGRGALNEALDALYIPHINLNFRFSVFPNKHSLWQDILLIRRYIVNGIAGIRLAWYARKHHIDIIHSNVSVIDVGYIASRLAHIPHIYHIREYGEKDFGWQHYVGKSRFLNRLNLTEQYNICITKDIQHYVQQDVNPHSIVIYDGVLSINAIHYCSQKEPYFLFAGRLLPAKGIMLLLQAYSMYCTLCTNPIPLHIAGDTNDMEYKAQLLHIVETNHLEDKVSFLGMRNDVISLMQEAIALIVPSISEGFGFITTEAMFSGCLVIGNDVAGTKEQFDNGQRLTEKEIGLRYTTQEQLVQHLLDITESVHNNTFTHMYEPMILRGQRVVKQLYTTECNTEQIYQFYKNITQ